MATQVQFRGGTTTEHASFNGAAREVTVDTTKQTLVVQDGSTNGGFPLLGEKNADNVKVYFGTGNDLQIYHDGSNSIIEDTGTGQLRLCGDNAVVLRKAPTGDVYALGNADGSFELFYDNSKKLETTSVGVNISGDLQLQGADGTVDWVKWSKADYILTIKDGANLEFGNSRDLKIYHDGSNSWIRDTGTGKLIIDGSELTFNKTGNQDYYCRMIADGAVELYWDNSKKLETTSTGVKVSGAFLADDSTNSGTGNSLSLGSSQDLKLYFDASNAYCDFTDSAFYFRHNTNIKFYVQSGGAQFVGSLYGDDNNKIELGNGQDLKIYHNGTENRFDSYGKNNEFINKNTDGSVAEYMVRMVPNAATELYYDSTKRFETTSVGATLTGRLSGWYDASQVAGLYLRNSNDSGTAVQFVKNDGGVVGSISQTASATSYNTSSDYRLKENEVAISDGITRLKTLKPYRFNFKDEPSKTVDGFFAHEVTPAVPEAIAGEKDGTEMQQLDYSKLSTLTIAALQEAITKIETLETKVAALESS